MSEARSIATVEERTVAPLSEGAAIIAVIERAALNPDVDVEKMERLYAMHEKTMARQAKAAFTSALAEMQQHLPVIDERGGIKDKSGKVQSTYAKWEDINAAIKPVLHQHGFALTFRVVTTPKVAVTGVLSHREGHSEETTMELPVDGSGSKNDVQAVGSSFSYGKRYTAIALLNITSRDPKDRDDDGQAAGRGRPSDDAQDAIADINACEGSAALIDWRDTKANAVRAKVSAGEWSEIIALWNRRAKAVKDAANG